MTNRRKTASRPQSRRGPEGICAACGQKGRVELHHPAGAGFVAEVTVPVCPTCHRHLTARQYDAGLEFRPPADAAEVDAMRALLVGLCHLHDTTTVRLGVAGADWLPPLGLLAEVASQAFDLLDDPTRPGRWTPDPIAAELRAKRRRPHLPPVDDRNLTGQLRAMFALLRDTSSRLYGPDDPWTVAISRVADNAASIVARLTDALADKAFLAACETSWLRLAPAMRTSLERLRAGPTEELMAGEGQTWIGRTNHLLDLLVDTAAGTMPEQPTRLTDLPALFEQRAIP